MFPRFMVRKEEENDRLCPSSLEQIRVGIVTWRKPSIFNDLPPPPHVFHWRSAWQRSEARVGWVRVPIVGHVAWPPQAGRDLGRGAGRGSGTPSFGAVPVYAVG